MPFVKRTKSGIRKFDDTAMDGLKIVECLKKSGMTLKDIKQFLDWCAEGSDTLTKRRDMFHERRETVLAQLAELHKVLDIIAYKCWYYETAVAEGSEEAVKKMIVPPGLTKP